MKRKKTSKNFSSSPPNATTSSNRSSHYPKKSPAPPPPPPPVPQRPSIIELNTADSTDLVSVDGIGPVFAKRILAYRERLGGFHSTGQLREVFGIDEERFEKISAFVKTDSTYIRKINVNTAGVSDLKKHPYISPNVAQGLVNYRKQHGTFRNVTDIRSCVLVSADLYRKIAPYLTI